MRNGRRLLLIGFLLGCARASAQGTMTLTLPQPEWFGDLRYRTAQVKEAIDDVRNLEQLRVRLGFKADVNDTVKMNLRLATGTSAISTNQTLGDPKDPGMPRRSFGLDMAYVDWRSSSETKLWAGRIANPFWAPAKIGIIYDGNLVFEGLAFKWERPWSSSSVFVNLGAFMISENYNAPDDTVDTGITSAQGGYSVKTEWGTWTGHLATHQFVNIRNKAITTVDKDAKVDPYSYPFDSYRGNSVFPNDPLLPPDSRKYYFVNPYVLNEAGLEWKRSLGPFDLTVFYDFVKNAGAAAANSAQEYGIGAKWGRTQMQIAQVEKQADSVVAAFSDNDSNGGGTDNRGARFNVTYQLAKNSVVSFTNYRALRGVDTVRRPFEASRLEFLLNF